MKKIALMTILVSVFAVSFLVFSSCKKESKETEEETITNTADNAVYKFTGTIDGVNISYGITSTSFYGIGGGNSKLVGDSTSVIFRSSISNPTNGNTILVRRGTLVSHNTYVPKNEFNNYFIVGNVNYSPDGVNGVEIVWNDGANQKTWKTAGTSQTGSNFNFETVKYYDLNNDNYAEYKAVFNCKLTDGNGNIKTLTNGILTCYFVND